ncbi:MAG: tetratricopeptide repeat protein [Vicinamibacterales bacterium]
MTESVLPAWAALPALGCYDRRTVFSRLLSLTTALSLTASVGALSQEHPSHRIPTIPDEVLTRPVTLRAGVGKAHDAVATKSEEAQAFYDQGLAYLHSYVWIEAARSFNQSLRVDPTTAMAHVGLSFAYAELNKPDASRQAFAKAQQLSAGASDHDRRHIAARAEQLASEAAPADLDKLMAYRRTLDSALAAQPTDAEFWILRGISASADPFERGQGSAANAVLYYEKALALGAPLAHHYLTHAYENTGQFARAAEHSSAYALLAPGVPHALHMRGHVLRRTGQVAAAVSAFDAAERVQAAYFAAERIAPEYEWHHEHNLDLLGSSYQYLGQMERAARALKAAFDLPSSLAVQMYDKRGWPEFLIGRGRLDEALAAANILASHPVSLVRATGHIEAGHVHLASGKFALAAEQINQALRDLRAASSGQVLISPAFEQLQGEFYLRTGQRERGRTMLREVVRKIRALPGPDNWVQALFAMESIAQTARAANDLDFAAWAAQQMVDHDPNYAGGHYELGLAARLRGDQTTWEREVALAARLWANADPSLAEMSDIRAVLPPRRTP